MIDFDFLSAGNVEERRRGDVERVAGLAIVAGEELRNGVLGLDLIGGGRDDVVNLAVVAGARMVGGEFAESGDQATESEV